jgi:predicted lipoprotein with Yx(FWY)xxD motif
MRTTLSVSVLFFAIVSVAAADPAKIGDTAKGKALTNSKGMTLYMFDKDTDNKSNCNGPCAALWPALKAEPDVEPIADWTIVTRDDGSKQWAYKTKPVYTWSKDSKPGDITGDGFGNVWHIARP